MYLDPSLSMLNSGCQKKRSNKKGNKEKTEKLTPSSTPFWSKIFILQYIYKLFRGFNDMSIGGNPGMPYQGVPNQPNFMGGGPGMYP